MGYFYGALSRFYLFIYVFFFFFEHESLIAWFGTSLKRVNDDTLTW